MARAIVMMPGIILLSLIHLVGLGWAEEEPARPFFFERRVLANQLVLLVSREHSLPVVTGRLLIDAGAWRDPPGQDGLARLTAKGLLLGTAQRTAATIDEELDFMGASLTAEAGRDYAMLSFQALKRDLDNVLDLFVDVLTQPAFPAQAIQQEVEKSLASMQTTREQPREAAEEAFRRALFLSSSYGRPLGGTYFSLRGLTAEAVRRFYHSSYHPNAAILAVVGDITAEEVETKLLPRLAHWPMGQRAPVPFTTTFAPGPVTITIDRALTQANIVLGQPGVSRDNPDFYALAVMNYILGGRGFGSRLGEEIRDKRGLAYAVESRFEAGKHPGTFLITMQTQNTSAREVIAIAREQMQRMHSELVSEQELESAKRYLIGSLPWRFDTQQKLANFLTQIEYYGLGLGYPQLYPSLIGRITREEVQRVARTYLHPEKAFLVVVGDLKQAGFD